MINLHSQQTLHASRNSFVSKDISIKRLYRCPYARLHKLIEHGEKTLTV